MSQTVLICQKYLNIILNIFQTIYLRFYPYPFYITLINVQFYPFWFSKTILGETSETKAMLKHKEKSMKSTVILWKSNTAQPCLLSKLSPQPFATRLEKSFFFQWACRWNVVQTVCRLSYKDWSTSSTQPTIFLNRLKTKTRTRKWVTPVSKPDRKK